ncbi:MAG: YibE/F family protein [Defluviitaleaceae bacterium]|nr:YibE/F family protein [Defluviitaleaceae bacterium]
MRVREGFIVERNAGADSSLYKWVLILSVAFLVIGNRVATDGAALPTRFGGTVYSAIATEIVNRIENNHDSWETDVFTTFRARIRGGELRGTEVTAEQLTSTRWLLAVREVEVGDRVLLFYDQFSGHHRFHDYIRINYVIYLGALFLVLVVLFGKRKGLNSLIALGFTCMAVFSVFVPAILSGRNIYATTIITCAFVIISTLLTVVGLNKKALSSMLGCMGGVLLAGIIMLVMDRFLNLTGLIDDDTRYLRMLGNNININAIIFASVTIGAMGAIMDVAMSIASSLWEVRIARGASNFHGLFTAGINIGKDILGTMLNTLILAYIGSSLSTILLIIAHTNSYVELFNREMVIVELLRALTGSFGMFLAIPLTAALCGFLYSKSMRQQPQKIPNPR